MQPAQMNFPRVAPVYVQDKERIAKIGRSADFRGQWRDEAGDGDLLAIPRERMIIGGHHLLAQMNRLRLAGSGAVYRNAV